MRAWWLVKIAKVLVIASAAVLVFGGIVMGLWNAIVPELFHGPTLTFWQAIGLFILTHIFFRGFAFGGHGWRRDKWRHRFEEKLAAMSPEEREAFKQEYRRRCGHWPRKGEDSQTESTTA